jgi:alpha-1,2-mannosyltransferase
MTHYRLLLVVVPLLTIHLAFALHRRTLHSGDFDVSREFGRRFVAGERLYEHGLHFPYPPAAAMLFAPLALLPPAAGFLARYAAACAALAFVLATLAGTVGRAQLGKRAPEVAAFALVLASHYLIRDLDDAGPHLILLAILVAAAALISRGRDVAAAACLGLAAAAKPTAALFIPVLLWKRAWRAAAAAAVATVLWAALPALWMGIPSWAAHVLDWARTAIVWTSGEGAALYAASVRNQGLAATIGRFGVPPLLASLAPVLLVAACLPALRPHGRLADPRWHVDAAAVMVLATLVSPITWVQHLVLALPALYLLAAEERAGRGLGAGGRTALAVYAALALLLNREFVGKGAYLALLALGMHTVAMGIVLALLLLRRPMERE